jgi:hypothetical protein
MTQPLSFQNIQQLRTLFFFKEINEIVTYDISCEAKAKVKY